MRTRSGMLFQHGALFSSLSVFDNIAQPFRELGKMPEDLIRDFVMLKLEMVGLSCKHATKMPSALSGGMIKRVGIARAIALEPELLFLDEPTAGLDPEASDEFVELIAALHRALGLTVVMVTHDLDTMVALSTRVAVLADRKRAGRRAGRRGGGRSIIRSSANISSAGAGAARCRRCRRSAARSCRAPRSTTAVGPNCRCEPENKEPDDGKQITCVLGRPLHDRLAAGDRGGGCFCSTSTVPCACRTI